MSEASETNQLVIREVEVRTWPQRSDLLVIDPQNGYTLAHYPLQEDNRRSPAWDPFSPIEARAKDAAARTEIHQDFLRLYYELAPSAEVKLVPTTGIRRRMGELLGQYDLTLADIELSSLESAAKRLAAMELDALYELLCGWHDAFELFYPIGASKLDPMSWIHRATPDSCALLLYLSSGKESYQEAKSDEVEEAYALFRRLVDLELERFTFGHLLRWLYFHRAEFPDRPPFRLAVFKELRDVERLPTGG